MPNVLKFFVGPFLRKLIFTFSTFEELFFILEVLPKMFSSFLLLNLNVFGVKRRGLGVKQLNGDGFRFLQIEKISSQLRDMSY